MNEVADTITVDTCMYGTWSGCIQDSYTGGSLGPWIYRARRLGCT